MYSVHIWLRRRGDLSPEGFREYWLTKHAPLARDGYEHLRSYRTAIVSGAPRLDPTDLEAWREVVPYDGVATLTWDDRDGFSADMKSETAKTSTEDLSNFTDGFGLLFVDEDIVK